MHPTSVSLLGNIKIWQRITLAFILLLLVYISMGALQLFILQQRVTDFSEFFEHTQESEQVFEIRARVAELHRQMVLFRDTSGVVNEDGVAKAYDSLYANMKTLLARRRTATADPASMQLVQQSESILQSLGENISEMPQHRDSRDQSIAQLRAVFVEAREQVRSAQLDEEVSRGLVALLQGIFADVSRAETLSAYYLLNHDYVQRRRFSSYLVKAKDAITRASSTLPPGVQRSALEEIIPTLSRVEAAFFQAVQEDRFFNQLINVVVAGYVQELKVLSEMLTAQTDSRLEQIYAITMAQHAKSKQLLLIAALVGLFITAVIATRISRGIVSPLSKITHTFKALAEGEQIRSVPGLNRSDELGELSQAAEVFRLQSSRTQQLLDRSEQLTRALQQREDSLRQSNEELEKFAYIASHDLKSPLRAIDNLATWIQEDCFELLPDRSKTHFSTLQARIARMEKLLADILNYSRIGQTNLTPTEVSLNAAIDQALGLVAQPGHMSIRRSGTELEIHGHSSLLVQVLQNLLSNAIKYGKPEELTVLIEARQLTNGMAEIAVTDNGMGIAPEYAERIFEMFQTLQSRDSVESSGVGLAIVRKLVQGEGGKVWLDTTCTHGACFRFTWPLRTEALESPLHALPEQDALEVA